MSKEERKECGSQKDQNYSSAICFVRVWNLVADIKGGTYVVGSKSFRPDQLFKVTEIKQLCYFST